jgi:hypothetical protein
MLHPEMLKIKQLGGLVYHQHSGKGEIGGSVCIMEIITESILTTIGNYVIIGIALVLVFFIKWVTNRIKSLVLCVVAIMQGQIELGVNGDVKKRYDALIEQLTKD